MKHYKRLYMHGSPHANSRCFSIKDKIERYSTPVPECGCWLWTGSVDKSGYGTTKLDGKWRTMHRLSWEYHNGQIPKGLQVLHKCDVPSCINPEHLFLGTQKDNVHDGIRKGRYPHINRMTLEPQE
jgi:hypothetical protein